MTHFKKNLFFIGALFFAGNSCASSTDNQIFSFDDFSLSQSPPLSIVDSTYPSLNGNTPMTTSEEPDPTMLPVHISDSEYSQEEITSHTIRISAQVLSQDTRDIFQRSKLVN